MCMPKLLCILAIIYVLNYNTVRKLYTVARCFFLYNYVIAVNNMYVDDFVVANSCMLSEIADRITSTKSNIKVQQYHNYNTLACF